MNELALFSGAGGGILASLLHGWRTVAAIEIEDYPRRVLLQRQADGILPRFPIWDDVKTFDGKPWKGKIDIITGGFPCQDISAAGKGAGIKGERSGLWKEMARIIGEVRPKYVFVENSSMLISRGLETVISDLAKMGYDAEWCIVSAQNVGAPHKRDRIWIMANASVRRLSKPKKRKIQQSWGTQIKRSGITRRWAPISNTNSINCKAGRKQTKWYQRTIFDSCSTRKTLAHTMFNGAREKPEKLPNKLKKNKERKGRRKGAKSRYSCKTMGNPKKVYAQGFRSRQREIKPWRTSWWDIEPRLGGVVNGVAHKMD